ncbi:MAG TPA: DUF3857 domain-containing protein [Capsulimonadaceae bacterium]|nr:DUF3857 domain-containing protein [Capsulimonadaceae bacterium]
MMSRYIAFASLSLVLLAANAHAATLKSRTLPESEHAKSASVAPAKSDPAIQAILKNAPSASAYPNSAAITLLDESVVNLKADGTYVEKTHEIVKVFNERGRDEADVTIPFNSSGQKIVGLVAHTILPNGKVLPVRSEDIYTKAPFSDYAMYDDAKIVTFSMPGIEDGAIIDYSYTRVNSKALMPRQYSNTWAFSDGDKPAILSHFTITAPAALKLNTEYHNAPNLRPIIKTSADGQTKTYTWQMTNLPDIDPEPMMPPLKDIIPWMQVSTVPSWQTVSGWYWTLAKPQMQATPAIHDLVQKLTAGKTTQEAKAKALFYWVEQNVRYVAVELGESAFRPHSAAQVLQNRYGDCKDMATLLVTMLRDAGITDSQDVLIGAGSTDTVSTEIANTGAFNHCIARATIDGKPYWFDCTAEICGFGSIPGADRGANVLVVHDGGKGEFETVPKATPDSNINITHLTIALHPDGSAVCKNEMIASGDTEMAMRAAFREVKPDMMQDVIRSLVNRESPNATLDDYKISDLQDRDTPFHMSYSYDAPVWAQSTGNLMIINPAQVSGMANSFSKPSRKYPIYSNGSASYRSTMTLTIPQGYTIEDQPVNASMALPFGNFQRTVTVKGDTVEIAIQFDATPCMVPPDQYQKVKDQAEKLRQVAVQPLILKKAAS